MTAYLDELRGRLAAASVDAAEACLRQFALHVIATDRLAAGRPQMITADPCGQLVSQACRLAGARAASGR